VIYRQYNFFNPKIACSYRPANGWYINASVGRSNSQPFRDDFINATPGRQPKSEQLTDYELEIQKSGKNWSAIASFYYMKYKDQLILTGELNDVGAAVRTNVAESYGRGVELQLSWQPFPFLQWTGNGSFSSNIIRAFDYLLYDYDNGGEVLETFVNTPISFSPSTILYSDIRLNHKKWSLDVTAKYIGQQYLDNTGSVERAIDPYTVINSTLSWKTKIFSNSVLQLSGQIFNLADLKYSSNGYTYSYLYGGLVTENFYYPQAGRHFMLSCKIDW
ncbi:MAG TPA: TonB-dependent receptor, partial [Saprospiraceae bacterium]|nr:TonB-dependent receptor [Saprospiraceae bacterium]